jgi:hypothetical protein
MKNLRGYHIKKQSARVSSSGWRDEIPRHRDPAVVRLGRSCWRFALRGRTAFEPRKPDIGRAGGIRTRGLFVPKKERGQAESLRFSQTVANKRGSSVGRVPKARMFATIREGWGPHRGLQWGLQGVSR